MSTRNLPHLLFISLALAVCAVEGDAAGAGLREFAEAHCGDCHDGATHKAGFDLEKLELLLSDSRNARAWEQVYDRVANGEMPPKSRDQPSAGARAAFLANLGKQLRAASLERQETTGRAPVRRLTRLEYETTVNDLLHIRTDLRSFFPEDAVTAGFDKVGEGLTLSAAHFAAYQTAAEKALTMAIEGGNVLLSSPAGRSGPI